MLESQRSLPKHLVLLSFTFGDTRRDVLPLQILVPFRAPLGQHPHLLLALEKSLSGKHILYYRCEMGLLDRGEDRIVIL